MQTNRGFFVPARTGSILHNVPDLLPPPVVREPASTAINLRWLAVGLFFFIMVGMTLSNREAENSSNEPSVSAEMIQVRMGLQLRSVAKWLESQGQAQNAAQYNESSLSALRSTIEPLREKAPRNAEVAALYGSVLSLMDRTIPTPMLRKLSASKSPADRSAARIVSSKTLSKSEAEKLAEAVEEFPDAGEILSAIAFEKAGDKTALERAFPASGLIGFMAVVGVLCLGFVLGLVAWVLFFSQKNKATWKPQGHPFDWLNADQASKLGLFSVGCFGMFITVQLPFELGLKALPESVTIFGSSLTFLILLGLVLSRVTIGGQTIMSWLNRSQFSLGKQIGIGILGWGANLPIILVSMVLMQNFIKNSNANHPITEMISQGGGGFAMFALFFAGAVAAPLWEEVAFRGALFGGMNAASRGRKYGVVISVALSSLAFAAIHPQGPALWLMLGWIGAMGCLLTYYTRSIIPAIVMHAVHNGTLLLMSISILG